MLIIYFYRKKKLVWWTYAITMLNALIALHVVMATLTTTHNRQSSLFMWSAIWSIIPAQSFVLLNGNVMFIIYLPLTENTHSTYLFVKIGYQIKDLHQNT